MERQDAREMLAALLPRLRRLAAALSGSLAGGDELVLATLRQALDSLNQWPEGMRFDSWVFRILHGLSALPERRARHGTGMDWEPDDRMVLHNARVAVAELPEMQRLVLALVDVEGLSYGEAARTLEIPLSDLAVYLARGRVRIAKALDLDLGERKREEGQAVFPDDLLIAAADGELNPARKAEIAARLQSDAALERRGNALREAGKLAEEAFQDILQEEIPPALEAPLRGSQAPAPSEPLSEAVVAPSPRKAPGARVLVLAAAAAVLLAIGLAAVASPQLAGLGGGFDAVGVAESPLDAPLVKPLSTALDREVSDSVRRVRGGRLRILMSFRDVGDRYCRYYEAVEADAPRGVLGVACRRGGRWTNVLALPARGEDLSSLRAGPEGAERLEAALDRLMLTDALPVAEEQRLIRTGWPEASN